MTSDVYIRTVRPALMRLAERRRRHRVLRVGGIGMVGLGLWVGLWVLLERWWVLPAAGLWAGLLACLAGGVAVVWQLARERRTRESLVEVAAVAEAHLGVQPESIQTVVWAFERPLTGESRQMALALAELVAGDVARLEMSPGERRRTWVWAAAALLLWVGFVCAGLYQPGLLWAGARLAMPWAGIEPPYGQRLVLLPQNVELPQGGGIQWSATLSVPPAPDGRGELRRDRVPAVEVSFDRETWSRIEMTPRGSAGFVARLDGVDRDVWYRGVFGPLRTPDYIARVLTRPALRSAELEVSLPASLGGGSSTVRLEPVAGGTESNLGAAVPVGSGVRLRLSATEPLRRVGVTGPGVEVSGSVTADDPTTAVVRLPPELTAQPSQALALRWVLEGRRGGSGSGVVVLTTLADADPTVRVVWPRSGTAVGPRDDLEVVVLGEDDAGLESGEVRLRTARGVTSIPLGVRQTPRRWRGGVRASLPELGLSAGEKLWVSAVVRDTSGRTAVSEEVDLTVSQVAPDPLVATRLAALVEVTRAVTSARSAVLSAAEALEQLADLPAEGRMLSLPGARLQVAAAVDAVARLQRALARAARTAPDSRFADAIALLADRTVATAVTTESALQASAAGRADRLRELGGQLRSAAGDLGDGVARPVEDLRRGDAAVLLVASRDGARGLIPPDDDDLVGADDATLDAASRVAAARLDALGPAVLTEPAEPVASVLAARLELAWRIEALRPDILPQRAADLQAAATAARQAGQAVPELVRLLSILEAEHAAARAGRSDPAVDALARSARERLTELSRTRDPGVAVADPADLGMLTAPASRDDPDARRATRLSELARTPRELAEVLRRSARPMDARTASSLETALRDLLRTLDGEERAGRGGGGGGVTFVPSLQPIEPRIEAFRIAALAEARLLELEQSAVRLGELLDGRARLLSRPDASPADLSRTHASIAEVLRELAPGAGVQLRDELRRFSPELSTAALAAERTLVAALSALPDAKLWEVEPSAIGPDVGAQTFAALAEVAAAVRRVRAEIETARISMTRRDPMSAARANTGAAIAAMRRREPDTALAARFAAAAADALDMAAEQARRSRTARLLALLPELMAFAAPDDGDRQSGPPLAATAPPQNAPDMPNGPSPTEQAIEALVGPEQLRDSVRTYFELLQRLPGRGSNGGGAP